MVTSKRLAIVSINVFWLILEGEYYIRSISAIKRAASGDEFVVEVAWEGLEEAASSWEPVSRVYHDASAVLRKELKALRLKAEQKRALVQLYGLRFCSYILWFCGGIQDSGLLTFCFV